MNKTQENELKLFQNSVAMTVALISFGMLFASMFLGYFLIRFSTAVWPPVEIQGMPTLLPFISTIVIALSSLTYYFLEKNFLSDKKQIPFLWMTTFSFGILFLVLQWTLWSELKHRGILVSNGMAPSMVYAFSWVHAAHIVLGLMALIYVGYFVFFKPENLTQIKLINIGKFWHFLGVMWFIIYLMMFVL